MVGYFQLGSMALSRVISRLEQVEFALRLSAWAETGGRIELIATDEPPRGSMRGQVQLHSSASLPWRPLPKGVVQALQNLVAQSGVLDLPTDESDDPLLIGGVEFQLLDGVHYEIEVYWAKTCRRFERFMRPEARFARLFNAALRLMLAESPLLAEAEKMACCSFEGGNNAA